MTEIPPAQFIGTGDVSDPISFDAMRKTAPDPVVTAVAGLARTARSHATEFIAVTTGLPADLREVVNKASDAVILPLGVAANARAKAESFLNDVKLYPEGRKILAGEVIKGATDSVAESFERAETLIDVASALTYEAARPRVAPDAALTARTDLAMIVQRHNGNPAGLIEPLKRLAQRGDSVGALVADGGYLADFLDSQGADQQLRDAITTVVRAEVIKAAAVSDDPKRAAAGKTNLALVELRKAHAAALSYTRHILG